MKMDCSISQEGFEDSADLNTNLTITQVFEDTCTAQVSSTYDVLAKEDFRLCNLN